MLFFVSLVRALGSSSRTLVVGPVGIDNTAGIRALQFSDGRKFHVTMAFTTIRSIWFYLPSPCCLDLELWLSKRRAVSQLLDLINLRCEVTFKCEW